MRCLSLILVSSPHRFLDDRPANPDRKGVVSCQRDDAGTSLIPSNVVMAGCPPRHQRPTLFLLVDCGLYWSRMSDDTRKQRRSDLRSKRCKGVLGTSSAHRHAMHREAEPNTVLSGFNLRATLPNRTSHHVQRRSTDYRLFQQLSHCTSARTSPLVLRNVPCIS